MIYISIRTCEIINHLFIYLYQVIFIFQEAMKIMGLSNWLHWSAWFVKCFVFIFISVVLMIVLLKIRWYSNTDYTVFTYADPLVMLFFMTFYICATITFCFALSVFFSRGKFSGCDIVRFHILLPVQVDCEIKISENFKISSLFTTSGTKVKS